MHVGNVLSSGRNVVPDVSMDDHGVPVLHLLRVVDTEGCLHAYQETYARLRTAGGSFKILAVTALDSRVGTLVVLGTNLPGEGTVSTENGKAKSLCDALESHIPVR